MCLPRLLAPQALREEDTRTRLIWPALRSSGWGDQDVLQEYVIAPGRIEAPHGVYLDLACCAAGSQRP